jgi:hypothetical protein
LGPAAGADRVGSRLVWFNGSGPRRKKKVSDFLYLFSINIEVEIK